MVRVSTILSRVRISAWLPEIKNLYFCTNQGSSEGPETFGVEYSTWIIWFCIEYFCSNAVWKVVLKKEAKSEFYKNSPSRSGFYSPRGFCTWFRYCRSPSGLFSFFVSLLGAQSSCIYRRTTNLSICCHFSKSGRNWSYICVPRFIGTRIISINLVGDYRFLKSSNKLNNTK